MEALLLKIPDVAARLGMSRAKVYELMASGTLRSVRVDGCRRVRTDDSIAFVANLLGQPFSGRAALLSPFDRLIHDRKRTLELFDYDYQLEMYKPATKRRWGYFTLPILYGDRLVGKLDATADRDAGALRVNTIHHDVPFTKTMTTAVHGEIKNVADWLELDLRLSPLSSFAEWTRKSDGRRHSRPESVLKERCRAVRCPTDLTPAMALTPKLESQRSQPPVAREAGGRSYRLLLTVPLIVAAPSSGISRRPTRVRPLRRGRMSRSGRSGSCREGSPTTERPWSDAARRRSARPGR
jgi:excisionase family DNA binding protein